MSRGGLEVQLPTDAPLKSAESQPHSPTCVLVLGGARSGKSAYAERVVARRAAGQGGERAYIATAQAFDAEMTARIAAHRAQRGERWRTIEAPLDLPDIIATHARRDLVILIDCLTLWLTNEMLRSDAQDLEALGEALVGSIRDAPCDLVLVSNEVGLGLVPDTPLGRAFRDAQGRLNQQVAAAADSVAFVAAGLPMMLKGEAPL